jgi:hypothetical protein
MSHWNLIQCVFDRTALSANEDVAVVTMHIRSKTTVLPDSWYDIVDADRDGFKAKLDTFWSGLAPIISSKVKLVQYKFYDVPSTPAQLGAPKKTYTVSIPGTSSSQVLPPQNALSVTWKTDQRKTWGRFYVPGLATNVLDTNGRVSTAWADSVVALAAPLASRSGTGACLVVFSHKEWTHHDPQQVQCDDVSDVIRRRRFSSVHYRALATIS